MYTCFDRGSGFTVQEEWPLSQIYLRGIGRLCDGKSNAVAFDISEGENLFYAFGFADPREGWLSQSTGRELVQRYKLTGANRETLMIQR
jgi:hypothetical protein